MDEGKFHSSATRIVAAGFRHVNTFADDQIETAAYSQAWKFTRTSFEKWDKLTTR